MSLPFTTSNNSGVWNAAFGPTGGFHPKVRRYFEKSDKAAFQRWITSESDSKTETKIHFRILYFNSTKKHFSYEKGARCFFWKKKAGAEKSLPHPVDFWCPESMKPGKCHRFMSPWVEVSSPGPLSETCLYRDIFSWLFLQKNKKSSPQNQLKEKTTALRSEFRMTKCILPQDHSPKVSSKPYWMQITPGVDF